MRPAPSGLQGAEVVRASNGGDMIVVIQQYNAHEHSDLLDEMFRLRARVFRDRLRWDVQVADGKERDKYDDERPVYLVYADDESRKVKGSLRLLPTTGPTVLADIFSGYASRRRASQLPDDLGVHPVLSRRPWRELRAAGGAACRVDRFDRGFRVTSPSLQASNRSSATSIPRCSGSIGALDARSRCSAPRNGMAEPYIWDCSRSPRRSSAT